MDTAQISKAPVRIPFVCPVCAGANAVELLVLSRAGGVSCSSCQKHLRSADVMRAIHAPREAVAEPRIASRAPVAKKTEMVWPPTAESRAAIAPMKARRGDGSN